MGVILIVLCILLGSALIFGLAKLIHYVVKGKIKLQSIFLTLMTLVLLPLLTILIYREIGNYWSSPTQEDSKRLGEMITKTVNSPDYQKIAREETVYAIQPAVSRFNRPKNSFIYEVYVSTDKDTYIFTCNEKAWEKAPVCPNMHIGGWAGVYDYKDGRTFFKGYKGFKDGKEQ